MPIGGENTLLSEKDIEALGKAHYKIIDIADTVYIVNIDCYFDKTVSEEMRYAKEHNKEIIFHETLYNFSYLFRY